MKYLHLKLSEVAASLFIVTILLPSCKNPSEVQSDVPEEVRIPDTEEYAFFSEIMDYTYGIYVTLPASYYKNPERIFPAVYIVDGNQYMVYTNEPYGSLVWGNMVKEHISVSVSYRPGTPNLRARDFRCTERAADFVRFFREELIPFVEEHYRTSGDGRTLFGHSLGGHFTLFTLLTATGTFENYISCAPAVSGEIIQFETEYAASHGELPVKLFMIAGEMDHLSIGMKRFVQQLESHNYGGLEFKGLFIPDGNHCTVAPIAYEEGLRFVMDPVIPLSPDKLERLAGSYEAEGQTYQLSYEGGDCLQLEAPGTYNEWIDAPLMEWKKIYPVTDTVFISRGWPGTFTFGGVTDIQAATFEFNSSDGRVIAHRK